MKKMTVFFSAVLLISTSLCFAQDNSYETQIAEIIKQAESLSDFLKSTAINFTAYDKWYKDFKSLSDKFVEDFSKNHIKEPSFQAIQEGVNHLDLIWNALKQVEYAENEYKETITSGDVAYAHKWKNTASQQRKKAFELIPKALEYFYQAKEILGKEG
jgi:hypothetical protein